MNTRRCLFAMIAFFLALVLAGCEPSVSNTGPFLDGMSETLSGLSTIAGARTAFPDAAPNIADTSRGPSVSFQGLTRSPGTAGTGGPARILGADVDPFGDTPVGTSKGGPGQSSTTSGTAMAKGKAQGSATSSSLQSGLDQITKGLTTLSGSGATSTTKATGTKTTGTTNAGSQTAGTSTGNSGSGSSAGGTSTVTSAAATKAALEDAKENIYQRFGIAVGQTANDLARRMEDGDDWTLEQLTQLEVLLARVPSHFVRGTDQIGSLIPPRPTVLGVNWEGTGRIFLPPAGRAFGVFAHNLYHEMTHAYVGNKKSAKPALLADYAARVTGDPAFKSTGAITRYGDSLPQEDLAEAVASYLTNGPWLKQHFRARYDFIRERFFNGEEFPKIQGFGDYPDLKKVSGSN